jgi:putative intracellular protease/amidase
VVALRNADVPVSPPGAAPPEVVAGVCHGPAGLVAGKSVSSFTDDEERAVGLADVVPFLLQTELRERGAVHSGAPNFQAHVVADGRLVTGQNPASAAGVAEKVVEVLAKGA